MKILIFGAGGVGSVLGGFLARMGHEVSLLGRAWHLDAVEKEGLRITGIWGDYRVKAFDLYRSAEEIRAAGRRFDLIFLTVKSFDTREAAAQVKTLMDGRTMLVSFQNGLGNIETILEFVRPDQFLPGRVIFGVDASPGAVQVTVTADPPAALGALPGGKPLQSPASIAHLLSLSKIPTVAVQDILTVIWSKVIYNCALNPLCSLHEIPYGKILEREDTKKDMEEIIRECYHAGQKSGVRLEPPDADGYLDLLVGKLIPYTASHYPSMLRDIQRGKRTDIEALNGAICRLGEQFHIETPVNRRVTNSILTKSSPKKSV